MNLTAYHLKRLADVYRENSAYAGIKGIYEGIAAALKHDKSVTRELWNSRLEGLCDNSHLTGSELNALMKAGELERSQDLLYYSRINGLRDVDSRLETNLAYKAEQERKKNIQEIYSKVPNSIQEKSRALRKRRQARAQMRKNLIMVYGLKIR